MKFLHTGDLHIGKTVNEFSMLEDQKHILEQILDIAVKEHVDAVVIAGDVYDRPIPSTEAVELLDEFLTLLMEKKIPVIMISGNHDSGERVAFADKILEKQGIHIAGGYDGELKRVLFEDEWGNVDFVCMPFVKPAVATVEDMLGRTPMAFDLRTRHVLVTHYFVTGENGEQPELSDAETSVNVGGLDNVSADCFAMFDYVALGHIHKRQRIGAREVWYAGAPLKYSFSEASHVKSVNLVTLEEKGNIRVEKRDLTPLHEMRVIRGELEALISPEVVQAEPADDYIKAILTNEEALIDPIGTLRSVYPNVMQIEPAKREIEAQSEYTSEVFTKQKSIGELFGSFYEMLRGEPMDEQKENLVAELEKRIEG